jgi:hypothetical protein
MRKLLVLGVFMLFLASGKTVLAGRDDGEALIQESGQTADEVIAYWTPERLRAAADLLRSVPESDLRAAGAEERVFAKSAPSTPLFTSSRIVPESADTSYPYSTVGRLTFTIPGQGMASCSAAVINRRLVLTAGHCVHKGSGDTLGFYTNFMFTPAYHNGQAPFGTWTATAYSVTAAWAAGKAIYPNPGDFGVLEIADQQGKRIGDVTGRLNVLPNHLYPNVVTSLGYPSNIDGGRLMHQVVSQSIGPTGARTYAYGSDMQGAGGGPWVQSFGRPGGGQAPTVANAVVGVTSFGVAGSNKVSSSTFDAKAQAMVDQLCLRQAGNCD